MEMIENKINELEDRQIELTLSEQQAENRSKQINRDSGTYTIFVSF